MVDTPESELFPVQETESTEETAQPAQTSVGIHLSSQTIFMLSFAAIVVVVVVIILVMSRKKAGPKKNVQAAKGLVVCGLQTASPSVLP